VHQRIPPSGQHHVDRHEIHPSGLCVPLRLVAADITVASRSVGLDGFVVLNFCHPTVCAFCVRRSAGDTVPACGAPGDVSAACIRMVVVLALVAGAISAALVTIAPHSSPAHADVSTGAAGLFVPAQGTMLDTRTGIGGVSGPVAATTWYPIQVAGQAAQGAASGTLGAFRASTGASNFAFFRSTRRIGVRRGWQGVRAAAAIRFSRFF
jgi:hypothetical protein